MEREISFTKEEMIDLLDEWVSYVCEDIKKYGFPEPFANHPFHFIPDYVDAYFE